MATPVLQLQDGIRNLNASVSDKVMADRRSRSGSVFVQAI